MPPSLPALVLAFAGLLPTTAWAGKPLVVELFTSQGCSSCPPADVLLSELHDDPDLIPLAFHVDYWDRLGWKDPFSDPAWTRRQRAYAQALPSGVYTPELVIQGQQHVVGNDPAKVKMHLAKAHTMHRPGTITASLTPQADASTAGLTLDVATTGPEADVLVVITEDDAVTKVPRGENAGRTLRNDAVVRQLRTIYRHDEHTTSRTVTLTDLPAKGHVVVLLQDPATLHLLGATRLALP